MFAQACAGRGGTIGEIAVLMVGQILCLNKILHIFFEKILSFLAKCLPIKCIFCAFLRFFDAKQFVERFLHDLHICGDKKSFIGFSPFKTFELRLTVCLCVTYAGRKEGNAPPNLPPRSKCSFLPPILATPLCRKIGRVVRRVTAWKVCRQIRRQADLLGKKVQRLATAVTNLEEFQRFESTRFFL